MRGDAAGHGGAPACALSVKPRSSHRPTSRACEPRIDPSPGSARRAGVSRSPATATRTAVTPATPTAARRAGVTIEQGVEVGAIERQSGRVHRRERRVGATRRPSTGGRDRQPDSDSHPRSRGCRAVTLPIIVGRHPVFVVERGAEPSARHVVYLDLAGGAYVRPETGGLTLDRLADRRRDAAPDGPGGAGRRRRTADEAALTLERTRALGAARWRRSVPRAAGRARSTSRRTGCRSSIERRSTASGSLPA